MNRYIGVETAVTRVLCSRINALQDDSAAPVTNYVAIDDVNGNSVNCTGTNNNTFVLIKNTSGSNALTVTQVSNSTTAGIVLGDVDTVIPFGDEAIIGPINHSAMLNANLAIFSYAGTTPSADIIAIQVSANDA